MDIQQILALKVTPVFFSWELSTQRALVVLEYLVKESSLDQSNMSLEAFAHYQPIADNGTEVGKAQNRRVEFYITKKATSIGGTTMTNTAAKDELTTNQ